MTRFMRRRPLLVSLALLMTVTASSAAQLPFYIGTYTKGGPSEGIYRALLDSESGKLSAPVLAAKADSPNFLALSPDGRTVYATQGSDTLAAYGMEKDGTLTFLNAQPAGGDGPCHVSVDATGRNVLITNYGAGSIACFRALEDGSLGERTAFVAFTGSGPDPRRQEKPHAHSIHADPENRRVYACDLGTDRIWIFELDAGAGTLSPAEPAFAKVPPGGGPRHMAIHPSGRTVYVNNEMGMSVTVLVRDPTSGGLEPVQTLSTLPEGEPAEGSKTAAIFCGPSGRFLYVSNRGPDTIMVYAIGGDGRLTVVQNAPAQVAVPRGMGIDPSGRWLITAGQDDNQLAVLSIDPDSGSLELTGETVTIGSPVSVLFVPSR